MHGAIRAIDAVMRETSLFAAAGLLVGGLDDLMVDLLFLLRRWLRVDVAARIITDLPAPAVPPRFAVFVAAWDEAAVIGQMLATATAQLHYPDYRIFVGLYPNDRGSIDAAARVAADDPRVILVIGGKPGPTTKADCLNTLWAALRRDDARSGRATTAVVLHDAEDVVHRDELTVFAALMADHRVVQLPVVPLIKRSARLVSGHYADEFAEHHGKGVVVRTALGAGMPLAGTGCAIAVSMLAAIADLRDGAPFDAGSLTEDYELYGVQDKTYYVDNVIMPTWQAVSASTGRCWPRSVRHNNCH